MKGLLILRNSPLNCGKSPNELLFNSRLRDDLPKFLKPSTEKHDHPVRTKRESAEHTVKVAVPENRA